MYTVVCVACVYPERVCGCEVDSNAGVGDGRGVVVVSSGHVGGHVVLVLCLAQLTFYG